MRDKLVTFLSSLYTFLCIKKPDSEPDPTSITGRLKSQGLILHCSQDFSNYFSKYGFPKTSFYHYESIIPNPFADEPEQDAPKNTKSQGYTFIDMQIVRTILLELL